MPKIRIEFDKTNCIGNKACMAMDFKRWKDMGEKVDLIGGKEIKEGIFILEGNYSDEEVEVIVEGASVCPVNVVTVKNLETNEYLFEGTPLYKRALADGYIKAESDTAEMLNYWDRWQHIKLKKKNPYLNLLLNLMRGPATKTRLGLVPRALVKKLINPKYLSYNVKNEFPTKTVGSLVSVMDWTRENVAKPVYRTLPVGLKSWYDQVRYKA